MPRLRRGQRPVVTILGGSTDLKQRGQSLLYRNVTISYEFMGIPTAHEIEPGRPGQILATIAKLVDAGALRPEVRHRFPLERLADAHRQVETGRTVGKVAVIVRRQGSRDKPRAVAVSSRDAESPRFVRRARPAHRRRAHGPGLGRPLRRREGAAHHPGVLREASLPEGADPGNRRARVVRLVDPRLRLRRPQCRQLRAHLPGAGARRLRHPQLRLGAELAVHVSRSTPSAAKSRSSAGCRTWRAAGRSAASA